MEVNTVYVRHAVVTEPIDQSHDFSFIHKFYYENYYNETRAFMGSRKQTWPVDVGDKRLRKMEN